MFQNGIWKYSYLTEDIKSTLIRMGMKKKILS